MFGNSKRPSGETKSEGRINCIVGEGSSFQGGFRVEGCIRVDGEVEGSLVATDTVIVGKTGVVKAEMETMCAVVAGTVAGNINASERVQLEKGARVEGDIRTPNLKIEEGVFFQGRCHMSEDSQDFEELGQPVEVGSQEGM
jgi:cytoskeletal protein CcmA (bactofilin family)